MSEGLNQSSKLVLDWTAEDNYRRAVILRVNREECIVAHLRYSEARGLWCVSAGVPGVQFFDRACTSAPDSVEPSVKVRERAESVLREAGLLRHIDAYKVGNALREARTAAGKTMGDLARFLGITVAELSAIERGRVNG